MVCIFIVLNSVFVSTMLFEFWLKLIYRYHHRHFLNIPRFKIPPSMFNLNSKKNAALFNEPIVLTSSSRRDSRKVDFATPTGGFKAPYVNPFNNILHQLASRRSLYFPSFWAGASSPVNRDRFFLLSMQLAAAEEVVFCAKFKWAITNGFDSFYFGSFWGNGKNNAWKMGEDNRRRGVP